MRAFPLAVLILASAMLLPAQSTSAQITGTITDASNAVIPGTAITVTSVGTGVRREATSNELGNYTFALLPPGGYRMTAQKDGFKPISRTGIVLQVDQVARINFIMEVGAVTENVEVVAAAPLLQQESSALGQRTVRRYLRRHV